MSEGGSSSIENWGCDQSRRSKLRIDTLVSQTRHLLSYYTFPDSFLFKVVNFNHPSPFGRLLLCLPDSKVSIICSQIVIVEFDIKGSLLQTTKWIFLAFLIHLI